MSSRYRSIWLLCLLFPLFLVGLSIWRNPFLFDATVENRELGQATNYPVLLYTASNRSIYFTNQDLLYPNNFQHGAAAIDVVAIDVPSIGVSSRSPLIWSRQVDRLLNLKDSDGIIVDNYTLSDVDREFAMSVSTYLRGEVDLSPGEVRLFLFPKESTVRISSGLQGIVVIGVAGASENSNSNYAEYYANALNKASKEIRNHGYKSIGLPCIGSLVGDGQCDRHDWVKMFQLVSEAGEKMLPVVVFGGWAITANGRNHKTEQIALAWKQWQKEIALDAEAPTDLALRTSALALAGSLVGASIRQVKFTVARLVAYVILSGALLGIVVKWMENFSDLWRSPFGVHFDLIALFLGAFLFGYFVNQVARFKPSDHVG